MRFVDGVRTVEGSMEQVVDAEAVYGRKLLDEVAAVTAQLEAMKGDLVAVVARAATAVAACMAADERLVLPNPVDDPPLGLLNKLTGVAELEHLAGQVGLHAPIFDRADELWVEARKAVPPLAEVVAIGRRHPPRAAI